MVYIGDCQVWLPVIIRSSPKQQEPEATTFLVLQSFIPVMELLML
jgi:hypothetical protein